LQTASAISVLASVSALGATLIHNFADAIGPIFRVSHGLANAVYLPIVMKNMPSHYRPRMAYSAEGMYPSELCGLTQISYTASKWMRPA
jgi:alcohol dehydrogenase class IV